MKLKFSQGQTLLKNASFVKSGTEKCQLATMLLINLVICWYEKEKIDKLT